MGMKDEIDDALQAHAAWRTRFKDYLSGRASLDPAAAGTTDQCRFGRWLDKEGYRLMPEVLHGEIRDAHAEFHRVAADILHKIKARRFPEARQDMARDGAFNRASARLSELLLKASLRERGAATPAPPRQEAAPPASQEEAQTRPSAGQAEELASS